jgi:hypothetical protein
MPVYEIDLEDFFPNKKKNIYEVPKIIYQDSKKIKSCFELYDARKSQKCWRDHHPLPGGMGFPMPIKKKYDEVNEKFIFESVGSFCSFECMFGFASEENSPYLKDSRGNIMEVFAEEYPDVDFLQIKPSPHFMCLKAYGGNMTIEEYRSGTHRPKRSKHYILLSEAMEIKEDG